MHLRTASALTFLACGIVAGPALADPDHTYLEKDGIILFESEDAVEPVDETEPEDVVETEGEVEAEIEPANEVEPEGETEPANEIDPEDSGELDDESSDTGWQLQSELSDYLGSGYLVWTGPDSFPLSTAGKGNITYHFRVETAGNYQLLLRSRITHGESNTEANDSWVRLSTGSDVIDEEPLDGWTKLFMNTLGEWTWSSKTVDHVGRPIRQYFAQGDHTVEISGRSIGHAVDRIALYRYEDVPYNSVRIKSWELSSIVTGDGTVIDPKQNTDPEPEVVEPEEVEPEEVEPEEPVEVTLENLVALDETWMETINNVCTENTLAIAANSNRSVNPAETMSAYTSGQFLTVSPDNSSVLMKFDLSLVPPVSSAVLEYSTGIEASDGTVRYSLGSHSEWPSENGNVILQPDTMTAMSQASGGWQVDTRYQSELPAALLTSELITIILSNDEPSESLNIFAYTEAERTARLLLTGDDNFCADWQSNVDAHNAPVEPPPEINETPEPETVPEPVVTPSEETPEAKTDSSGGGFTSWLSLMLLSGALFMRNLRIKRQA